MFRPQMSSKINPLLKLCSCGHTVAAVTPSLFRTKQKKTFRVSRSYLISPSHSFLPLPPSPPLSLPSASPEAPCWTSTPSAVEGGAPFPPHGGEKPAAHRFECGCRPPAISSTAPPPPPPPPFLLHLLQHQCSLPHLSSPTLPEKLPALSFYPSLSENKAVVLSVSSLLFSKD